MQTFSGTVRRAECMAEQMGQNGQLGADQSGYGGPGEGAR